MIIKCKGLGFGERTVRTAIHNLSHPGARLHRLHAGARGDAGASEGLSCPWEGGLCEQEGLRDVAAGVVDAVVEDLASDREGGPRLDRGRVHSQGQADHSD